MIRQLHASLAIGVSALGTAITLVATMGGMTLGALGAGRVLRGRVLRRPARAYAVLEIIIGLAGVLTLEPGFRLLLRLDSAVYLQHPTLAPVLQLACILLVLGLPAAAMGATVPVFGLMARGARTSIAILYGVNTAGAALGVLVATFVLLPRLGVELTAITLASVNLTVAAIAWLLPSAGVAPGTISDAGAGAKKEPRGQAAESELLVVLVTGFVILGLEVAWFRALRAAFLSTTDSFAIMLTAVLVALGVGAPLSRRVSRTGFPLPRVLLLGGLAVLCATPLLERFDLFLGVTFQHPYPVVAAARLLASLAVVGPPIAILGCCLPSVLARHGGTAAWARIYTVSTLGAAAGSLVAGWVLLPTLGSERTAWLLGLVVLVTALSLLERAMRVRAAALALAAVAIAVLGDSGAWRTRLQGTFESPVVRTVAVREGPDTSIAVADDAAGDRILAIDGFVATSQGNVGHYMRWMGRLPMLSHPSPTRALVICFGTGQTADAVRDEGPGDLDLVELNPNVYEVASYFSSNHQVLSDPRVHPVVMDGRAWLRRTDRAYDVVTLEPMPPTFAGVNALYSREFYELVSARLRPGGVVAQWLPFHLLSPETATAIVATFAGTFGDAFLWVDPLDLSGILVGRRGQPSADLGRAWPGLHRHASGRDMNEEQIAGSVVLLPQEIATWARLGPVVTDDNQLLSYRQRHADALAVRGDTLPEHFALLRTVRQMTRAQSATGAE